MTDSVYIRDLIYFDFDKAASIFSQIDDGLPKETHTGSEEARDNRNIRKYDLKLFKPEFGGVAQEKTSIMESRVLHHNLLSRLEEELKDSGLLLDINATFKDDQTLEKIQSSLGEVPYIRVEGQAVIEDYDRVKNILDRFNTIVEFFNKSKIETIKKSDGYKELESSINMINAEVENKNNRDAKARGKAQIKHSRGVLEEFINQQAKQDKLEQWMVEGLQLIIDPFLKGRIDLRIYPFGSSQQTWILCNLKRECFLDADLENIIFHYGTVPNVKLTLLGLITSQPSPDEGVFDPMEEFENINISDAVQFEKAFRAVFPAMRGLESFARFSRYPGVTAYPIAVYRSIKVRS